MSFNESALISCPELSSLNIEYTRAEQPHFQSGRHCYGRVAMVIFQQSLVSLAVQKRGFYMSKIARFSLHGGTFKSVNMPKQPRGFLPFKGKRFSPFFEHFHAPSVFGFDNSKLAFYSTRQQRLLLNLNSGRTS